MFSYRIPEDYKMYRALHNTLALITEEAARRKRLNQEIITALTDMKFGGAPGMQGIDVE